MKENEEEGVFGGGRDKGGGRETQEGTDSSRIHEGGQSPTNVRPCVLLLLLLMAVTVAMAMAIAPGLVARRLVEHVVGQVRVFILRNSCVRTRLYHQHLSLFDHHDPRHPLWLWASCSLPPALPPILRLCSS